VIGTTFGVGDNSTTFNVPDYRGKSPLGVSASYVLASTGGSADAVVVSHTHTANVTDAGHAHGIPYGNTGGAANSIPQTPYVSSTVISYPNDTNTATTGISVANSLTGVSGVNANLPPYLAINFIIKT
jgi:microcystin-dependent protein